MRLFPARIKDATLGAVRGRAALLWCTVLMAMSCAQARSPKSTSNATQSIASAPIAPSSSAPIAPQASASTAMPPPPPPSTARAEAAERVLFLATHLRTTELREACAVTLEERERIRCLISLRYADEVASKQLALALYEETGSLAGLLPEETAEDGRGQKVKLKPARPIGANREHLVWILAVMREYEGFLRALNARAGSSPITFRDRPLDFRFFYSEKGGAPSAFAVSQNIGYNLYGTLNVSEEAVRDTLFHEIFHLNDAWHSGFSERALAPIYESILSRCKKATRCLEAYAPTDTTMNGQLYAFLPNGGVKEYAAELALRYFREQRLALAGKPLTIPAFKCGPSENAAAMKLVADEFFGGVDAVAPCEQAPER